MTVTQAKGRRDLGSYNHSALASPRTFQACYIQPKNNHLPKATHASNCQNCSFLSYTACRAS
jgi:hypothetical protein